MRESFCHLYLSLGLEAFRDLKKKLIKYNVNLIKCLSNQVIDIESIERFQKKVEQLIDEDGL